MQFDSRVLLPLSLILILAAGIQIISSATWDLRHQWIQTDKLEKTFEDSRFLEERIAKNKADIKFLRSEFQGALSLLPANNEMAEIYGRLGVISSKSGVEILQLDPAPIEAQNGFETLAIQLKMRSNFSALIRFLEMVEFKQPMARVTDLKLASEKGQIFSKAQLKVSLR